MRRTRGPALVLCLLLLAAACGDSDGELKADAGSDFAIGVGESPMFDGCGSDGDIANYRWVIIAAPDIMEGDSGKVIRETEPSCSFTLEAAMEVREVGDWVVELTVSDAAGNTSSDTVTVEVGP